MPVIIDGWNLVRNDRSPIKDDGGDSTDAAADLVFYFEDFQRTHRDPVIIVFDSSHEHLGLAHKNSELLKVVASRNADNYIKKYIDSTPERQRRNLRVVSSDSEIFFYAKSSYATPIKSEEFWGKLKRKGKNV